MVRRWATRSAFLAGMGFLLLGSPRYARAANPSLSIVDLGRGYAGECRDMSGSTYVGNIGVGWTAQPVLWSPTQNPVYLPAGTYDSGSACAINGSGTIVGWSEINAPNASIITYNHAVQWSGGMRLQYAEPAGATNSYANAINNAGVAAGTWDTLPAGTSSNAGMHAARWSADRTVVDLSITGETASAAYSINNLGMIAGQRRLSDKYQAVVWAADNSYAVLPDLYGYGQMATVINDAGVVGGVALTASSGWVPFYYDGQTHALPTVAGGSLYSINDINAEGDMVGHAMVGGELVPLLWTDGQVYNLRNYVPAFTSPVYGSMALRDAFAIDDLGFIAASGNSPSPFAATRPYVLTPEPASLTWLLGGLMLLRRRPPRRR